MHRLTVCHSESYGIAHLWSSRFRDQKQLLERLITLAEKCTGIRKNDVCLAEESDILEFTEVSEFPSPFHHDGRVTDVLSYESYAWGCWVKGIAVFDESTVKLRDENEPLGDIDANDGSLLFPNDIPGVKKARELFRPKENTEATEAIEIIFS